MSGSLLRSLLAAAVTLSGAAVIVRGDTAAAADTVNRTVLSDAFDAARGAAPDAAKWAVRGAAGQDGDGHLVLDGLLRSAKTFEQAYGRAEARVRVLRRSGAWRALGVLDEAGRIPAGRVETFADDRVDGDDFHTYAIDWTPTSLVWSLDGRKVLRFTPEQAGEPFILAVNLASTGRRSPVMAVDYVRVTVRVTVTRPAPLWKTYTAYRVGQQVRYKDVTYRVLERHTSLPGWQPSLVPALFQRV